MPETASAENRRSRYRIAGMDCAGCGTKIENTVRRLPGVLNVGVSVSGGTMTVQHTDRLLVSEIPRRVNALGYTVTPLPEAHTDTGSHLHLHGDHELEGPWWRSSKALLTLGCGLALLVAYLAGKAVPETERWAFLAAMAVGLVPVARRAIMAATAGSPFTIESLMSIAAVGAVLIGATEEAAVVVFLFLIGELLEGVAAGRARASIRGLTNLVPKTALVVRDDRTEEVDASALDIGSTILVRPGDRISADGLVVSGESAVDEAPVTGESAPKRKKPNDPVFAGTINTDAALRVKVTATAANNTIARVVRLVEEAQESKAPTERFIDRFSRWYTPSVLVVGALIAVIPPVLFGAAWGEWIYKGLAILLIGCPCALVISTPAAIAAGLSAGARRGLLLKGGAVLETLGKVTIAAFDKTGTLTEGKPQVTDVIPVSSGSQVEVLQMSAALEAGSSHPLAKAILDKATMAGAMILPGNDLAAVSGKGVTGKAFGRDLFLGSPQAAVDRVPLSDDLRARIAALNDEGKTVSVLVAGQDVAGIIAMRDEPRPDAKAGIAALKSAGVNAIMVTGDNRRTASAIAKDLGIEPRAELLPEHKQRIVRELQAVGQIVAKVGDGINDAPALAAADVGIAMGGGTDVALETADAAVLHGRVMEKRRTPVGTGGAARVRYA